MYLARDLKHKRPVAVKVLRPEIAEGGGEGSSAASALSPGGTVDLTYFRNVARVGHQVAEALSHAHQHVQTTLEGLESVDGVLW